MFNFSLKSELRGTIERIPKDLATWTKEIKRLKKNKGNRKKIIEYQHLYSYYLGKLMAYIYILKELRDSRFVNDFNDKHGIIVNPQTNKFMITRKWK